MASADPIGPDDRDRCTAKAPIPQRWRCEKPAGHDGPHAASDVNVVPGRHGGPTVTWPGSARTASGDLEQAIEDPAFMGRVWRRCDEQLRELGWMKMRHVLRAAIAECKESVTGAALAGAALPGELAPASAGEDILSDAIERYLEELDRGQADPHILTKARSDAVKARREGESGGSKVRP